MHFAAQRRLGRRASGSFGVLVKRRQFIPPFVEQTSMDAELLRQRDDVVAASQPLDRHSAELPRPPSHSSLAHLQSLSLQSVPQRVSQFWGSVHTESSSAVLLGTST